MSHTPRPLSIALLAPCYWPEVRRGTERFARDLANHLVTDGHRPRLITSHPHLRPTRTGEEGLEVVRLPRVGEGRLRRRGFEDYLAHLPLSAATLAVTGPDVAHALYPGDALVAARWGRRAGRPTVFSYMGIPDRAWLVQRRLRARLTHTAATESDAVVALSQAAAREFRRTLGIDARVIHPGVDVHAFRPGEGRAAEPTIFSAAALATPHKRIEDLVEAFRILRRTRPDARLVLSRPADRTLERRILAADERIEMADVDDRAELASQYRRAWVSALPSVNEPWGLVLLESMACGTPVVGRRSGGIPEIVDRDGVGLLFDGGPAELAGALAQGLELGEDQGVAATCRARAEELDTRGCADRYEALYAELLAAGRSRRTTQY